MSNLKWQTVVFIDLDATILKGPFESAVFPVVFAELSQKSGLDILEIRRRVIQENLDRQIKPGFPATLAMDWDDILNTVAARLGVTLQAQAREIANSHAGPPHSMLLDHADEVLEQLASPRRAIILATKGLRKYQLPVLDALGLTPLFADVLTPDVSHALKQDIAFYGRWPWRSRLQISVGDNYEDDVVAPRRFGFKAVWKLNRPDSWLQEIDPFIRPARFDYSENQAVQPDAIILSLRELPSVVAHLEKSVDDWPRLLKDAVGTV